MGIIELFKSFNEIHEDYTASDTLIDYLDEQCPQWKEIIKEPNCWKEIFDFDIHVLNSNWKYSLADSLFSTIDNSEAELFVFEDEDADNWYRFVAARRLLKRNPEKFVSRYEEAVRNGLFSLHGWSFGYINEIFDFPNALQVAISMFNNGNKGYSISYLCERLVNNWEEYPQNIKDYIVQFGDYQLRKNCTQQIWNQLCEQHKFLLATRMIINENNYARDIVAFYYQIDSERDVQIPIFTPDIYHRYKQFQREIQEGRDMLRRRHDIRFLIPHGFDCPTIDYGSFRYTPSEQITRFKQFANESNDIIIANEFDKMTSSIEDTLFEHLHLN